MLVKMKVQTTFQGEKLVPDVEIDVNDVVANRWAKNGIATIIGKGEEKDPKEMTAKQLYKLCLEKGIEVPEKQSKEVYLEALGITE